MGLRVPEDVSVIGCDDIWLAEFFSPSLSSISHDKREMGRRIAKAIIDSIREKTDFGRRHLVSGKGRHARFFGKSEKRPIKFNSTVDIKKGTLFYPFYLGKT